MSEPTIYKPSIYNGPFVYNNGGGGEGGGGDFGNGGGIAPIGYKQVAGVYIEDGAPVASKQFFPIIETDVEGWYFKGRAYNYNPRELNQGTNPIYLFQFNSSKNYCGVYIYSKNAVPISYPIARACNGGAYKVVNSIYGEPPLYGKIIDYELKNGVAKIGDYTITDIAQSSPNKVTNISPFIWGGGYSSTMTCDLVTIYLKVYDTNDALRFYFVPMLRESDEYAGLYDIVNDVFYTNQYIKYLDKIPE